MEQQKDNKRTGFIGSSQASQGHNQTNEVNRSISAQRQPAHFLVRSAQSSTAQVGQEKKNLKQGFGYMMRRAEKLTTALYLVTDIMSEKEPMKWKAREIGVDLLSDITIASSLPTSEKMTTLRNVMKKTEKIIAFLDVAHSAHLMSEMNSSMLKREYLMLKDSIEAEWGHVYEKSKSIFSESFFDVPHDSIPELEELEGESVPTQRPLLQESPSHVSEHASVKDINSARSTEGQHRDLRQSLVSPTNAWPSKVISVQALQQKLPSPTLVESKAAIVETAHSSVTDVRGTKSPQEVRSPITVPAEQIFKQKETPAIVEDVDSFSTARNDASRNDRRQIIVELLKQKQSLTVKDIARSIPHVSEKTIQRELLAMVIENVLLKRGERRWSTYSLRGQ